MQIHKRIFLLNIILLNSWILFGQTSGIKKPFRYIDDKGDTLSVFTIADERNIAFRLASGKDCDSDFVLATKIIAKADTTLFLCNNQVEILKEEKINLQSQVDNTNKVVETYKKEVKHNEKQIKFLTLQRNLLAGLAIILTTLLIIK